jgi:hypothetical protein
MLQLRNGLVIRFQVLVGLNRQLRNGTRTSELGVAPPVAIASQSIDVRQNPAGDHKVRLLAGLAIEVESYRNSFIFKANQQFLGHRNLARIRSGIAPSANRLDKGRRNRGNELLPGQKEAKSGLFNPSPGILESKCSNTVVAHPLGARSF